MKEFRAIFPISSILVIRSGYAKKDHISILAVIQNIWEYKFGYLKSERKNYPMKEFRAIFSISSILVIIRVCKKDHISILSVIQKYGIYINLGSRFEWEGKNYPMKKFRTIFPISSILVIRSMYAKKVQVSILAVFQNICDLHKFGLQIWIQSAKITLWKNFGQFFDFTDFGHQVRVCKKRSPLNISCNSKNMGLT